MAAHPKRGMRIALCALIALGLLLYQQLAFLEGAVYPVASGDTVYKKNGTVVDASNVSDGYIMVKHKESSKRLKVRVSKGEDSWNYDLNGDGNYEVFPLQAGDGKYKVLVMKQAKGTQYAQVSSISFSVKGNDEAEQFLGPNQYVWYTKDSKVVAKSEEICAGIESNLDKVKAVNSYMKTHFAYDFMLAMTVQKGYLPNVDEKLEKGSGICFDISAIIASMLRVQGIPTKLMIGHADQNYHAWNECTVDGQRVQLDATAALSGVKVSKYTTERFY